MFNLFLSCISLPLVELIRFLCLIFVSNFIIILKNYFQLLLSIIIISTLFYSFVYKFDLILLPIDFLSLILCA